jgi:uncharacterized protein YbgA (DUF1722 family)/uncharacterized protein YbbK (DUF523 family)
VTTSEPRLSASTSKPIRLGISSCLLGEEVRFDGGHKRDAYIISTLGRWFEFVSVCPEVAIGMPIPRQPIRLVKVGDDVRVRGVKDSSIDVTQPLTDFGHEMTARLTDLCGYLFKRGSPTCGMERVKVYAENGQPAQRGVGAYSKIFMSAYPLLPCEEEGRLGDPVLRENFIERVFVYHRWQELLCSGLSAHKLVQFHTEHKFQVLAHNQSAYRRMGRLVAQAGSSPLESLAARYGAELMCALARRATRRSHTNVLQHLFGFVSDRLDADDRAEMLELIEQYRRELVPLVVPVTLLRHHFRRHPDPYVERQHYLSPHPQELALRNLV